MEGRRGDGGSRTVITLTVTGRLLATRGVAVFFALALATPVLCALAIRGSLMLARISFHGLTLDHDRVGSADERWPGVAPGDRVVALGPEPTPDGGDVARFASEVVAAGDSVRVRFASGTEVLAPVLPLPLHHRAALWLRIVVGTACMLIGLVAFVLRPGPRVSWLFLLFCTSIGSSLLDLLVLAHDPDAAYRLVILQFMIGNCLAAHLFLTFPRAVRWLEIRPWRALWLYLPIPPLAVICAFPSLGGWGLTVTIVSIWLAVQGSGLIVYLVAMAVRARRLGDLDVLPQYRVLVLALCIGLVVPTIWNTLRGVFGVWRERWVVHLNTAPIVVFIALTAWALVRHNVMAADRFTRAVVGHGVALATLVAGFVALLVGILLAVGRTGAAPSTELLLVMTAVASVSFMPLYRLLKRRVDHWFAREQAGEQRMTEELRELMRVHQLGDRERSLGAALGALRVLQAELSEMWTLDDQGATLVRQRSDGAARAEGTPLPKDGALMRALGAGLPGGVASLSPRPLEEAAQLELWGLGIAMAAPILAHGAVLGFVGVGRRRSGTAFTEAEQSFLATVAGQVGLAMERGADADTRIGRYRLERRLGMGGMAEVFLAWQIGPGGIERKVALKRPLPTLLEDPEAIAMFLDEARIAGRLNHRGVAQLHEVGRAGDVYFLAMEFVDGPSLRTLLRGAGAVPAEVVSAIGVQVLAALAHAHALADENGRRLGLVHRDVTPANIMLTRWGEVKLVDFGIARSASRLQVTRTGVVKGTLAYMAPEQAVGREVDARSDLFSVGVVLYELITRRRPFPDGAAAAATPPVKAPGPLGEPIGRALALSREGRFSDADSMRAALITAQPPASDEELAAWMVTLATGDREDTDADVHTIRGEPPPVD